MGSEQAGACGWLFLWPLEHLLAGQVVEAPGCRQQELLDHPCSQVASLELAQSTGGAQDSLVQIPVAQLLVWASVPSKRHGSGVTLCPPQDPWVSLTLLLPGWGGGGPKEWSLPLPGLGNPPCLGKPAGPVAIATWRSTWMKTESISGLGARETWLLLRPPWREPGSRQQDSAAVQSAHSGLGGLRNHFHPVPHGSWVVGPV